MGIQCTIEITREQAIDKALMVHAETFRKYFESLSDNVLEDYIEDTFTNYRIKE